MRFDYSAYDTLKMLNVNLVRNDPCLCNACIDYLIDHPTYVLEVAEKDFKEMIDRFFRNDRVRK